MILTGLLLRVVLENTVLGYRQSLVLHYSVSIAYPDKKKEKRNEERR